MLFFSVCSFLGTTKLVLSVQQNPKKDEDTGTQKKKQDKQKMWGSFFCTRWGGVMVESHYQQYYSLLSPSIRRRLCRKLCCTCCTWRRPVSVGRTGKRSGSLTMCRRRSGGSHGRTAAEIRSDRRPRTPPSIWRTPRS